VNSGSSYAGGGLSAGQSVLFEGGQTFTGCLVFSTGTNIASSSSSSPIVVGSYGTGRAQINSTATCAGTNQGSHGPRNPLIMIDGSSSALSGFTLQNLYLSAAGTPTQYGILIQSSGNTQAPSSYITVQNSIVEGFNTNASGDLSAEIQILGYALNGQCGALDHISIVGNFLRGSASDPKSSDDTGINGYGCETNITNINYSGNSVYNIGSTSVHGNTGAGIVIAGVKGGTVSGNYVHDIGGNVVVAPNSGGVCGIEAAGASNLTISSNEVARVQPIGSRSVNVDWDGIDLDGSSINITVEYNYTHDNFGPGLYGYMWNLNGGGNWGPNTFRFNISQNDGAGTGLGGMTMASGGGPGTVYLYNNTIFQGGASTAGPYGLAFVYGAPSGGIVANNLIVASTPTYFDSGNPTTMISNYTSSANPGFSGSPPFASDCTWTPGLATGPAPCPSVYQLSSSSSQLGKGTNLSGSGVNMGTVTYWGTTLGSVFNIGAY
jgi:hypothetical protein